MEFNVHTPERQASESQDQYHARRRSSHRANRRAAMGWAPDEQASGASRRADIKRAGGFRQYKRKRMAALRAQRDAAA